MIEILRMIYFHSLGALVTIVGYPIYAIGQLFLWFTIKAFTFVHRPTRPRLFVPPTLGERLHVNRFMQFIESELRKYE